MGRLEVETITVRIEGFYEKGKGEGGKFVSIPGVFAQLKEKLGFGPYPGTLNVRLRPEHLGSLALLRKYLDGGITILPPRGSTYCVGVCFMARFEGSERAAIVIPLVKGYYKDVVEVLAPVELREKFGLKEGDRVSVEVEIPVRKLVGLKAVIFDVDGTLFDNVGLFLKSFNAALEELGLRAVPVEKLKHGLNVGKNLAEILSDHVPARLVSKLYERINAIYGGVVEEIRPFKGVKEALELIKSRNIKTGLATGSKIGREELEAHLERHGMSEYFDEIVTGVDVERGKPYPDLVRECAERLGVGKGEFAYVGDTSVDIRSGRAAGGFTVSVLTGVGTFETLIYENPDCIINGLAELPERIGGE